MKTTHGTNIDAHLHLWKYRQPDFPWIAVDGPLARNYLTRDAKSEMERAHIKRALLVQAQHSIEETDWLLDLAKQDEWIAGVVGWTDLEAKDIESKLSALRHPKLVGIRHIAQDEDDDFLIKPAVIRGINAVLAANLTYDILVVHEQLDAVLKLLDQLDDGNLVLDHCAKPPIASYGWQPWARQIESVASDPRVYCKLSGLITECPHDNWSEAVIEKYLSHILGAFGTDRLIFGSDWPVCTLATSYSGSVELIRSFVNKHCPEASDRIFGLTATRAYNLDI